MSASNHRQVQVLPLPKPAAAAAPRKLPEPLPLKLKPKPAILNRLSKSDPGRRSSSHGNASNPTPSDQPAAGENTTKLWPVNKLKDHPLHLVHFPPLSEAELSEIVLSMRLYGQRDAIHILSDGTILDGRHRRLAAKRNGWDEVRVIVHRELDLADSDAIEAFLIDCNASRRQLSRLQQARLFQRRRELQPKGTRRRGQGELRDEMAKRFSMTGRNLDRYVTLLRHPTELQDAVEGERLTLVKALELMKLPADKFEPILVKLRNGKAVKKEVDTLLLRVAQKKPLTKKQLERLLRDFLRTGFDVERQFDAVSECLLPRHREQLVALLQVIGKLQVALGKP